MQEVFKTEQSHEIAMSQIMGRCYVMFVKDYFKMRPEVIINDNNLYCARPCKNVRAHDAVHYQHQHDNLKNVFKGQVL